MAPRIAEVIDYFRNAEDDGLLPVDGSFIDWAWGHCLEGFKMPGLARNRSALVNLQAAWAIEAGARVFGRLGQTSQRDAARSLAERLRQGVRRHCLAADGSVLDAPGESDRSQHGQVWAILADLVDAEGQHRLFDAALHDESLTPLSLYHTYFLFRAAEKLGRYEEVFPKLELWSRMVEQGMSTFPEEEGRFGFIRSACHAWTAWPLGEFMSQILGVHILGPRRIRIAPHTCGLRSAEGRVPLPQLEPGTEPPVVEIRWDHTAEGSLQVRASIPSGIEVVPALPYEAVFELSQDGKT